MLGSFGFILGYIILMAAIFKGGSKEKYTPKEKKYNKVYGNVVSWGKYTESTNEPLEALNKGYIIPDAIKDNEEEKARFHELADEGRHCGSIMYSDIITGNPHPKYDPKKMKYASLSDKHYVMTNVAYLTGFKGYYEERWEVDKEMINYVNDNMLNNPKFYSPAYYYHFVAKKDHDVIELIGKTMSLLDFNAELKSRQYMPIGMPLKIKFSPFYTDRMFEFVEIAVYNHKRSWEECIIELDVANRIMSGINVPLFEYYDDRVLLKTKLSGDPSVYDYNNQDFNSDIMITIEAIGLRNINIDCIYYDKSQRKNINEPIWFNPLTMIEPKESFKETVE